MTFNLYRICYICLFFLNAYKCIVQFILIFQEGKKSYWWCNRSLKKNQNPVSIEYYGVKGLNPNRELLQQQ